MQVQLTTEQVIKAMIHRVILRMNPGMRDYAKIVDKIERELRATTTLPYEALSNPTILMHELRRYSCERVAAGALLDLRRSRATY